MELQKKIIVGTAVVALFGTVTNYVFLSPILTLLLPLAIFVFNKESLQRPIFWLYVFLGMFLLSTILYDWQSLFKFGFYRRDGNFIISYAPLFILPLFSFNYDLKKYIRYFYLFVVVLYSLLFVYHYVTLGSLSDLQLVIFGGLFIAQNAVGGFVAIVASLGLAYFYNNRGKKEFIFFSAMVIILIATYSRGSILGFLMGVVAWYFAITKRSKMLVATIAVPVILTIGCVMMGYPYFKTVMKTHNEVETEIDDTVGAKSANVLIRIFYTFPRAYYMFERSPIVGTGVGSYNDRPIIFKEVAPYVSYNAQPHNAFDSRHAHHSYLHFLAEMGIAGLALFLVFWISLYYYLIGIRGSPVMRDFLLLAYFTLTFAAFTEHRITTPSNMLPFTISVGLFMMHKRKDKTYIIEREKDS